MSDERAVGVMARRAARIEPSATIRVKERALELKRQGVDVVDLTAGEPDFPTPPHICEAGIRAIKLGFTKYTANAGIPELREAIVEKLKKDNGLEYSREQIIVSAGAKHSIINAILTLVENGDEVLIVAPFWVSYPQQVRLADAVPVMVDTSHTDFKLTAEVLERYISPRTKLILFNSPCNPTGVVYSREELESLAEVLVQKNMWVISDEIYEKIIYDGFKHFSLAGFPDLFEKTIVVNGVSKAYSMTGWRIGYAAGPFNVIQTMSKIQSHFTSNACSISQQAALAALTGPQDCITRMRAQFQKRRDLLLTHLAEHPQLSYVYPQGAFYLFLNVSSVFGKEWEGGEIQDALNFCEYLIEKERLVTVPGDAFGAPSYIRISFAAARKNLEDGIRRLVQGIYALKQ